MKNNKPLTDVLGNVVLHRVRNFVRPQTLENYDALERVQFRVPWFGQLLSMRLSAVKNAFVRLQMVLEVLGERFEGADGLESEHIAPRALRDPAGRRVVHFDWSIGAACQKESVLFHRDLFLVHQDADGEQKGKQELVLLEQRSAHVCVKIEREVFVDVVDSLLQCVWTVWLIERN